MSCIDREKFLKETNIWLDGNTLVVSVEELREAPSEDVAPTKHGKWIYIDGNVNYFWCNYCKAACPFFILSNL